MIHQVWALVAGGPYVRGETVGVDDILVQDLKSICGLDPEKALWDLIETEMIEQARLKLPPGVECEVLWETLKVDGRGIET